MRWMYYRQHASTIPPFRAFIFVWPTSKWNKAEFISKMSSNLTDFQSIRQIVIVFRQ